VRSMSVSRNCGGKRESVRARADEYVGESE